jgi:hypothetical protein
MGANTQFVTADIISNAPLPTHGGRYGVIPHGFIIDETRKELANQGIGIIRELYKTNKDGQIAQGIYHLAAAHDTDMGMMFAWSNSYNKMMRFKCAVGASVFICMNGVVSGDLANYSRKHIGSTALQDAVFSIKTQLGDAFKHYSQLIADKELLKNVVLTRKDQASIIGRLFADEEILTPTQTSIVKREMYTPSYNYNSDPNSAWSLYNHVTLSLKESHPLTYLSDHQKVHSFFVNEYGQLITPQIGGGVMVDPIDEEDEEDVREDLIVSPAGGSDFDVDMNAYGVNFL